MIVSPASNPTSNEFPDIAPTQSSLNLDYESDIPLRDSPKVRKVHKIMAMQHTNFSNYMGTFITVFGVTKYSFQANVSFADENKNNKTRMYGASSRPMAWSGGGSTQVSELWLYC